MSLLDCSFTSNGVTITPFHLLEEDWLLEILRIRNDERVRFWMDDQKIISREDHLTFCRSLPDRQDVIYCIVESEKTLVGVVYLTEIDTDLSTAELGLYRDPDLKKKNVGVTLMASLETIARRTGIKMLRLRVRIENTRAIDLYRRVGYVEMKRSDVFIQMKKDIMS